MGRSLYETYPAAREIFERADAALGFSLSALCFEGPEEALRQTENTQPAILTVSIAAWTVLSSRIEAQFAAGHSLGEYSALVAAGALALEDALRLVRQRGRYMQEAAPAGQGAMAALRVHEQEVEPLLKQAAQGEVLAAANFNAPDQVVVAGHATAVDRVLQLARGVRLPVSAPFHCELMRPAQLRLSAELARLEFRPPRFPIVNNVRAEIVTEPSALRQGLIDQIPNPVRWTAVIRTLQRAGATQFIEVGPKNILTGLLKKIDPTAATARFGEASDEEALHAVFAR